MRRASWRSGFAPLAEPEPNKYAEIAPRNSRESIAIYATVDEINSSMVCDILKSSQNSSHHKTEAFSEQFLGLDAIRKYGHSGIFFKSPKVQNFPFQTGFPR
jgi:hypothetical protein